MQLNEVCCICFSDYDENEQQPVVTSCGHSICKQCSSSLRRTDTMNTITGRLHTTIQCPTCRSTVAYPLSANISYMSLITSVKSTLSTRQMNRNENNTLEFNYNEVMKGLEYFDKKETKCQNLNFITSIGYLRGRYVYIKYLSDDIKHLIDDQVQYRNIFRNHCSILSAFNHPNLLKFFGYSSTDNPCDNHLIFEYLPGGTLYDRLFNPSQNLDPNNFNLISLHRVSLAIDIAKAIAYQHGIYIVDWNLDDITNIQDDLPQIEVDTKNNQTNRSIHYHKDISLHNILLSSDMTAKLRNTTIDQLVDEMLTENPHIIYDEYKAPEVKENIYGAFSDIYSFGVILFELLCNIPAKELMPYLLSICQDYNIEQFSDAILEKYEKELKQLKWTKKEIISICKIAKDCINFDSNLRPTSMRVVLLALLQLQYETSGYTIGLDHIENQLQHITPITSPLPINPSTTLTTNSTPISQPPQLVRYHTGHYRRYYGGPSNGRWSCCENYDRDAEGCHSSTQIRHHPDRNKLWGEGHNWNCCNQTRTSDGCVVGPQPDQYFISNSISSSSSTTTTTLVQQQQQQQQQQFQLLQQNEQQEQIPPIPPPSQTNNRYHTGHYRRYYGGPSNGRWSCCESYDRDAEGCQSGPQIRHHPDRNKLWGEGHNWNCCGRERVADGCKIGPQPNQYNVEASPITRDISRSFNSGIAESRNSNTNSNNSNINTNRNNNNNNNNNNNTDDNNGIDTQISISQPPQLVRYHTGHYRRYYGGPSNGRWSCCENYDRDAEGCHSSTQVRHHPDRNKLWGEGYNWNCCGRERTSDGCKIGQQPSQYLVSLQDQQTLHTPNTSHSPPRTPQTPETPTNQPITNVRYHTGHYKPYYGGPSHGRWSCCESYDRDIEGCRTGPQIRHHPDRNKLWGDGYNWNCCGCERTSDGCKIGPQPGQYLIDPPANELISYHPGNFRAYVGGPTNGRWSCCESFDKDAEGCHRGTQPRHHPDVNKFWGSQHNWACCSQPRTADGCLPGPHPHPYQSESLLRMSSKPTSRSRNNTRSSSRTRRVAPSPDQSSNPLHNQHNYSVNTPVSTPTSSSLSPSSTPNTSSTLRTLATMGFNERDIHEAVIRTHSIEEAIEYLTSLSSNNRTT